MIYTISRERRSEDREQASSILATTVDRTLKESGIRGLIINERILNVFKKKISLLQTAFKKVNRLGGKSVKKLTSAETVQTLGILSRHAQLNVVTVTFTCAEHIL